MDFEGKECKEKLRDIGVAFAYGGSGCIKKTGDRSLPRIEKRSP
jgi:hypothetical protein